MDQGLGKIKALYKRSASYIIQIIFKDFSTTLNFFALACFFFPHVFFYLSLFLLLLFFNDHLVTIT